MGRLACMMSALAVVAGCSFDWDGLDPRLAAGGMPAEGGGAAQGGGGEGGADVGGGGAGVGGFGGSSATGGATGWYDETWSRRRALTPTPPDIDLADVPVLVVLDPSRVDYDATLPDGADLRFVVDDMVLPHEVERWTPGGTSHLWVKLPLLAADGSAGTMHMYYGNPEVTSTGRGGVVFDESFGAVWHLTDLSDATANGNGVTASAAPSADGQIAAGRVLDGLGGYVEAASTPTIDGAFSSGGTLEAWFRADSFGENGFGRIVNKAVSTMASGGWSLELHEPDQTLRFERGYGSGPLVWSAPTGSVSLSTWTYVAVVFDDSATSGAQIYLDGQAATATGPSVSGTPDDDIGNALRIGNYALGETRTFDGVIDEVRLSRVARSPVWIATQQASMTDALISYGPEETAP